MFALRGPQRHTIVVYATYTLFSIHHVLRTRGLLKKVHAEVELSGLQQSHQPSTEWFHQLVHKNWANLAVYST